MKVLIVGAGAREHALAWKISQSPRLSQLFVAPGNAGTERLAQNVPIAAEDVEGLLEWASREAIDLTVVGPEVPLVEGIADRFAARGLRVFGPDRHCAALEGSKVFSKAFMIRHGIPTALHASFGDAEEALAQLERWPHPLVVKASGLAAGKGVVICQDLDQSREAVRSIMRDRRFGQAGSEVVIEEFLEGTEASLLCLVSDNRLFPLESARDYKKALDGDRGPNTGGMGCYSPNELFDQRLAEQVEREVLRPTRAALEAEGMRFFGVLFIGLMLTTEGPKVLEYNVRFGDPETEVILPRLRTDLLDLLEKTLDGSLRQDDLRWDPSPCVTVVMAAGGYPEAYQKGKPIRGLNQVGPEAMVFHAGTRSLDGQVLSNGGRVLNVTALAPTRAQARAIAYQNLRLIHFDDCFFRQDIAL